MGTGTRSRGKVKDGLGGAVAEWSKALQLRKKISKIEKRSQIRPPGQGNL